MTTPLMEYFGSELRRAREALGVTQRQVADAVHYSESKVGAVERGEQLPSQSFAQLADEFLKTDGLRTGGGRDPLVRAAAGAWTTTD